MRRKLLVIDDEEALLDLFTRIFESEFDVVTATAWHDGLELIKRERPFLIFLDVQLPGICGLDALAKMRAAGVECPVWMISGDEETSLAKEALLHGPDGYLTKPFLLEALQEVVRNAARAEISAKPSAGVKPAKN